MSNHFNITTLVENTVQKHGLLAEHGLAFWLQLEDFSILFDTGQTDIIEHNAKLLGIDLETVDTIMLSHGHYDHTGGLNTVLNSVKTNTPVFMHPQALNPKFVKQPTGRPRYNGIPEKCKTALNNFENIKTISEPAKITDSVWCTGPIPRNTSFEDAGGAFFKDVDCHTEDDISDDQAVFIDTPFGLVVVLGCAHAGIINTLTYIKELKPGRPIHTVVGGTHLGNAPADRIEKTIDALRKFNIQQLYPVHCTGFHATARLWKEFPGRVGVLPVGQTLKL